jgi:KaiC/GvpD/RAD55 family RecA-like ATPase
MIEALRLEVAKLKERGTTQLEIHGGQRIGTAGATFLYQFPLTEELKLRDETPVRVVCDRSEVDGSVVSVANGYLIVALEEDLGPKIPSARLSTDDSFLVERLRQKIEEVANGISSFNHSLANSVLGIGPIESGFKEPDPKVFLADLNDDKEHAIRLAFGSATCFIWGPPGTGKTTTLAHIVESHYRANRSILIVSNTNIAVDTALEKIAGRLEREPEFYEGAVLRHGPIAKDELKKKYGDYVSLDQIVERLGADLEKEKRELENELLAIDRQSVPLRETLLQFEQFEALQKEFGQVRRNLDATKEQMAELNENRRTINNNLDTLKNNLRRAQKMGRLKRFLTGLNPERLEQLLNSETRALSSVESAIQRAVAAIATQEANQARLQEKLNDLRARIKNYPTIAEVRKELNLLEQSTVQLRSRISSIQQQLDTLRQQVVTNCRVLATTVYRTYLKGQVERTFDVVIVDEASMLMLPMTFFATGLATQSVVVAGDFRQLAPIVTSDDPLALEWLKKDSFEKSNIPAQVASGSPPQHLAILEEQFRMHENICACVNELFYADRRLKTNWRAGTDPQPFPFGHRELLYIDTSLLNPWASCRLGTYSRYNLLHALLISNLVGNLDKELLGAKGDSKIGITSPYSEQTKLLQALLNDRFEDRGAELAATVHRFQGNERDTIIVDLTDSIGARLSRFMKAVRMDEDGSRLLNVAISRARHRVILIGNFGFLRYHAPADGKLEQLLDYFEEFGEPINSHDLLKLSQEDWATAFSSLGIDEDITLTARDFSVSTEGTFYARFAQDLFKAQHGILIFSPFLTERRASKLIDLLRNAIDRGLLVRIVTCPPGDHGGILENGLSETINAIRELGITVDYRAGMHEKIAIIDDEILWHGSLNILSHRDTAESMLRIKSRSACGLVAKFVTTPTSRKEKANLYEQENPECPGCSSFMVWNNGRFGIYYKCQSCGTKIDAKNGRIRAWTNKASTKPKSLASVQGNGSKPCPRTGCGGQLVKRIGSRGPFLGCSNYRSNGCRQTENI